jgi:hypothetical protein
VTVFGLDRTSVSFPLDSFESDPSAWASRSIRGEGTPEQAESRNVSVDVGGVSAFVGVAQVGATGRWFGKIECNPARMVDPEGVSLCPVVELPTVMNRVWRAAAEVVSPACELGGVRVKRLDVARDFEGVEHPAFYVQGLLGIRRPWARQQYTYNDPARGLAQTLFVGSNSGGTRLYDNHAAKPDRAPEGSLRWEAECRQGWSNRYGGIVSLSDVDSSSVDIIGKNRWEWSGMGAEVAATDRVLEKVLRSGLSSAKQQRLLGALLISSRGLSVQMGKNQASEYARVTRELGIVLSPDLFDGSDGAGFVGHLDLDAGREMLRVA